MILKVYIVFLGAPGAGKGTQAVNTARDLDAVHIASGDLFRQAMEEGTELGKKIQSYIKKGILVPDNITTQLILQRMLTFNVTNSVILDGFPRTIRQAEVLDEALAKKDKAIDKVINIEVSRKELLRRLSERWICRECQMPHNTLNYTFGYSGKCNKCGGELYRRSDDTDEIIAKRLQVYFSETKPLIDYYVNAGKLVSIDGEGEIDEVGQRIITAIRICSN